jgi:hypothetical protein
VNISGYSDISSIDSYEARKASSADSKSFSIPDVARPLVLTPPDSLPSDFQSKIHSHSQDDYRMDNAYMQVDSQREYKTAQEEETDNFLKAYIKEDEVEDEEKKHDELIDYLLKALKGEEKELRMEGNTYMDAEVKMEYIKKRCPGLFASKTD